jgi:hypothetical protein
LSLGASVDNTGRRCADVLARSGRQHLGVVCLSETAKMEWLSHQVVTLETRQQSTELMEALDQTSSLGEDSTK